MTLKNNSNNRYRLYINSCIELAKSIIIKFDDIADNINTTIMTQYGLSAVDLSDKSTWKYYLNLAGEYHTSDTIMKIKSLDVDEEIILNKVNLIKHKTTKLAYSNISNRYYKELVTKYPNQEMLIRGILFPIPISKSTIAKNGEVLGYPSYLVENNEYNLIYDIQTWIDNYLFRWTNSQYAIAHDLYIETYISQFYLHLLQAIITTRLNKCMTIEAHSYHIRQYLASHGFLDSYLDTLNNEQALFFYRNIRYIENNSGKKEVFDWLIEKIMSLRNLSFYEVDFLHNTKNILIDKVADNIFKTLPLNPIASDTIKLDRDLDEINTVMVNLASGNKEYCSDNYDYINNRLRYSDNNKLKTKLLQSSAIDRTDMFVYSKEEISINHWIYLVAKHKYLSSVYITLPKQTTNLKLSAQEAAALYIYSLHKIISNNANINDLNILKYRVSRVVNINNDYSLSDLIALTDTKYVSLNEVEEIYETKVFIDTIYSVIDFKDLCGTLFAVSNYQYLLYSSKQHHFSRAMAQVLVGALYVDETLSFSDLTVNNEHITYQQLLDRLSLNLDDYTIDDYTELASSIVTYTLALDINDNNNLTYIQKSMSDLFMQLSSYSIRIVNEIDANNGKLLPFTTVRMTLNKKKTTFVDYVEVATSGVFESKHNVEVDYVVPMKQNYNHNYSAARQTMFEHDISLEILRDIERETEITYFNPTLSHGADMPFNFDSLPDNKKEELFYLFMDK